MREISGDELLAAKLTRTAVDIARGPIALRGAGSAAIAAMVARVAECYDPTAVPRPGRPRLKIGRDGLERVGSIDGHRSALTVRKGRHPTGLLSAR